MSLNKREKEKRTEKKEIIFTGGYNRIGGAGFF